MNYSITINRAGQGQLDAARLDGMFRLRHCVFNGRLGWAVRSENDREHDWFDLMGPYYLVASDPSASARVVGCWRLLPTLGPTCCATFSRSCSTARLRPRTRKPGK
jgi:acyl homoserine lactone synthase